MHRLGTVLTVTVLTLTAAPAAGAAPPAATGRLIQLDSLGGVGSFGAAMNERGDILGASSDADGNYRAVVWWHGERSPTALGVEGGSADAISNRGHVAGRLGDGSLFLWRDGVVTRLPLGAAASFSGLAINNSDRVAATATDADGRSRAFVWHRGRVTTLPVPAGAASRAVDINDAGQITGTITRSGTGAEQAVLWRDGRMTVVGGAGSAPAAINESGLVAGNTDDERPFLWRDGRTTDLLAGTDAVAGRVTALNAAGTATGYVRSGDHAPLPVVWRDGGMTRIGPPGQAGGASFVNDRGDVVGVTWPDPQSLSVPFRWRNGRITLYPEPAADIAHTILGIDRHGHIAIDQETSRQRNIVLRSA